MTDRRFVVDASPLILLSRAGHLALLSALAEDVVVPYAVWQEVLAGLDQKPEIGDLPESLRLIDPTVIPPEIEHWDLGPGETAVLAFAAATPGYEAVLDDRDARRCAEALSIPTTGTVGVVLRARQAGLISAAKPVLDALLQRGLYLTPALIEASLDLVGEAHPSAERSEE